MTISPQPDFEFSPCPLCGCKGIHACTGKPIVWSPEDVKRFHNVLSSIFGERAVVGEAKQADQIDEKWPWIVYSDLDGVHTDFYGQAARIIGQDYKTMKGADAWIILDKVPHLFRDLAPLGDSAELWEGLKAFTAEHHIELSILSAMPRLTSELVTVPQDKFEWVRTHLSGTVRVNLIENGRSKAAFANPRAILIDDLERNVDEWRMAGGIGILHTSAAQSLKELNDLTAKIRS